MNGKIRLGIISVTCAAVLLGVFFAGFWYASYRRDTSVDIDVGMHSFHIQVWVERADGTVELVKDGVAINNAGVLTNIGKNKTRDGVATTTGVNATYISLSTSSSSPSAAWTQIPSEIATGGLARASATYTATSGQHGVWTLSYQFTASDTHTNVQLAGFNWASSGDGNLLWADTFTPVTLNSGDKLTITGSHTVS